MRTKHVVLAVLFLMTGSLIGELQAQENIKAVMNKCITMDNVDVNRIRSKDRTIITVTFKNNDALMNEISEACRKDEPQAEHISESKKNGKMVPNFYRFDKGSFSIKVNEEDNSVSATFVEEKGDSFYAPKRTQRTVK
ncbi:DUF5024 domain-containing protein [Parabacteroides sp. PF5-6]|uniref:DUF5024 domain-containing protein n=1 Tax=Parabacteroides sp. PF5-6 TaxID=1742403 RepID=UPI0024075C8A|nr:DUF5024 domain-containing protein [Parabacteroides sp. PF5-6]MDF9828745.1 hypothetical protein [Parabacteroides sp. PF5-6]